MHDRTKPLRRVDAATCASLLDEALRRPFDSHERGRHAGKGPLRQGETAYIRDLSPSGQSVYEDNLAHFPVFRSFIRSFFGTETVGKSYWHRMGAGRKIFPHVDCGNYYDATDRFQLFPSADSGHVAFIDGAEERYENGTLLAFNTSLLHSYENRSQTDCVFLVFDLYPGRYNAL